MNDIEKLRFPIGAYNKPAEITKELITKAVEVIERFPTELMLVLEDLTPEQSTKNIIERVLYFNLILKPRTFR